MKKENQDSFPKPKFQIGQKVYYTENDYEIIRELEIEDVYEKDGSFNYKVRLKTGYSSTVNEKNIFKNEEEIALKFVEKMVDVIEEAAREGDMKTNELYSRELFLKIIFFITTIRRMALERFEKEVK